MKKIFLLIPAAALLLSSCGDNGSKTTTAKESEKPKTEASNNSNYKNGISIKENGLVIEKAILVNANDVPIGEDNTVEIGDVIYCKVYIKEWKSVDGKANIGASEQILTSAGDEVLNEPDLFSGASGMVDPEAAKVLTLQATITKLTKSIRDFEVKYRLWDKNSNADATGSYVFHLK